MKRKISHILADVLWDLWCVLSVIGIWPRFIEPRLVVTTKMDLEVKQLPKDLEGFKVLQFSDLHFHKNVPQSFLDKVVRKIKAMSPDMIVFSGDMICYSRLEDEVRLTEFLNLLKAPYGSYFVFGNHDYEKYVSFTGEGKYDVVEKKQNSFIIEGFRKMFNPRKEIRGIGEEARLTNRHAGLCTLLGKTPFEILENQTKKIKVGSTCLNVSGLGDYWLGRCDPSITFETYDKNYPGLVLSHNPDTFTQLQEWPGEMVLCGHTHGGQVNLPFLWNKFIYIENMKFVRGLVQIGDKKLYVNRGLGSHRPFRWFSPPELLLLTLKNQKADC
ncbi:MAG: putative MPP superfamily phosphohydrolase [Chlamydiales bacterium]